MALLAIGGGSLHIYTRKVLLFLSSSSFQKPKESNPQSFNSLCLFLCKEDWVLAEILNRFGGL